MKKIILVFGLISGIICSFLMILQVIFADRLGHGYVLGYTTIVLCMLLVYFGVRSYRDEVAKGQIAFGKAFLVGLAITMVSCIFYVAAWEIAYFKFIPHSMDNYGDSIVRSMQASGKPAAEIQAKVDELNKMKAQYQNPLYNMAYTFMEPFPVGLVITLVSAAILRRK